MLQKHSANLLPFKSNFEAGKYEVVDKSHKNNFVYSVIMLYAQWKFLLLMSSKLCFYSNLTENRNETEKFYDQ